MRDLLRGQQPPAAHPHPTGHSRRAARGRCSLLLMFRHGLRVSEACGLQLSQVDIESRV
jgi:type 1 fimbriae regulatory protein FimB